MQKKKSVISLILFLFLLQSLATSALAPGPDIYFTNNVTSTGTSPNVTSMEQELLDLINGATVSIDLAIYDFNRDSIRDALIAAHNRGVTVRVVTDDEASEHNETYKPYYDSLKNAGIGVVDDNRPSDIMHNKFWIFDGAILWSGSTNITDNGFTKNHNNSLFFTSTEMADIFIEQFEQMYVDNNFSTAKTASPVTAVTYNSIPIEIYFSPKDDAMDEVVAEVNNAQESIYFSIFFFTDDDLRDAMIAAHNRGVTIRGVWDLLGASNAFSDDEALCDAGIPIKIENYIGKMHNKFMVIDPTGTNPRTITGSMNWTGSGDTKNDENTLIIHDGDTAVQFKTFWDSLYDPLDDDTLCIPEPAENSFTVFLPMTLEESDASGSDLPPPPPPEAIIDVRTIVYNPDGNDVEGELVVIENSGNAAQTMDGWTLFDEGSAVYTFPTFTLSANSTVTVWVKAGSDDATNLYWGRSSAVWNNTGDTATLQDAQGGVVSSCTYPGGGESFTCP